MRQIATHCLTVKIGGIKESTTMKFEGECDQAESIRYTCSRDPAHYSKEIILLVNWLISKTKKILQKQRRRKTVRLYVQGCLNLSWSHAVIVVNHAF